MIGRRRFGLGVAALAISTGAHAQSAKPVLRVVPQAEPQVFDPHQSGVNATQEHVALVYDTLFSWDADMVARPQMVDAWSKSDDGLLYSFTLRPGLKFHDLTLTSRDVVATLRRPLLSSSCKVQPTPPRRSDLHRRLTRRPIFVRRRCAQHGSRLAATSRRGSTAGRNR